MARKNPRSGFTLIELLVVIAISIFITTIAVFYSGESRNEIGLSVESAKISGLILQAKQLAIATYGQSGTLVCGYGMYFDIPNQQYSLFIYSPQSVRASGKCPPFSTIESSTWTWSPDDLAEYSASVWKIPLSPGVVMASDTTQYLSAVAVLFYPPDPETAMVQTVDGQHFEGTSTSYVDLSTVDGNNTSRISISPAGQVSFQP